MFRLIVLALALLAATLPAAADPAPREVYQEYHGALKRSFSDTAIWPYFTQAAREEFERKFPADFRGRAFYMMKTTAPAEVRVVDERIDGEVATVTVRPAEAGKRIVGTATLRREDGQWKLEKVVWQQE